MLNNKRLYKPPHYNTPEEIPLKYILKRIYQIEKYIYYCRS